MKPSDLLKQIEDHLRDGKLATARQLSDALSVSERTIYRQIPALRATGVRIRGEAGVGYILRERP